MTRCTGICLAILLMSGTCLAQNQPPVAVSLTPDYLNVSAGTQTTFVMQFSDPNGASDIDYGQARFVHTLGEMPACNVTYEFGALYLHNDAGTGLLGPLYPGSGSTISNSYCTVFGTDSSASAYGNYLTVTVKVSFTAPFAGNKNVYLMAGDWAGASSGWQLKGTWTIGVNQPPAVSYLNPSSGQAPPEDPRTFTLAVTDPDGAGDIDWAQLGFVASFYQYPACSVTYEFGAFWLHNDSGTALLGPLYPGSGSIENSSCRIGGSGSSALAMGNNLTVTMTITFKTAFAGTKQVYAATGDWAGAWSGWQSVGTWSVQVTQYYSLTTSVTPPEGGSLNPSGGVYASGTEVTVTATPNGAYRLTSFTGVDWSSGSQAHVLMNANRSMTANFTLPPVVSCSAWPNPANVGQLVTFSSAVANGAPPFWFLWSGVASGSQPTASYIPGSPGTFNATVQVTDSLARVATGACTSTVISSAPSLLTTNVYPPGAGTISPPPPGGWYATGSPVQVTATPAAGYTFFGFSGDLTDTVLPQNLVMNGNKTVTANFTPTPPGQYSLTTGVNTAGAGTITPGAGSHNSGSQVQVTAEAAPGYMFTEFTGDLTGTVNPQSVMMSGNKSVTANFAGAAIWVSSSSGPPPAQSCDLTRYAYCWTGDPTIVQPDPSQPRIFGRIRPYVYAGTTSGVTLYFRGKLFLGGSEAWNSGVEVASSGEYKPLPADGTGVLFVPGPTESNVVDATVTGFGKYYLQFETYGVKSGVQTQVFRERPVARLVPGPPTISGNPGIWYLGSAPVNDNCDPASPVPNCYYNSTQLTVTPGPGTAPPSPSSPAAWTLTDPATGQPPTFARYTCADGSACSRIAITASGQPNYCSPTGNIQVRVLLAGMSSDPYPIIVDWPQATIPFDTADVGIQAQGQIGYLSITTLKLQSGCGNSMFRMAWHEEFPTDGAGNVVPFHRCADSEGWTDPIPKANWATGLTDGDGFMKGDPPATDFDGIAYACGGGVPCKPLAAIPGTVGGGQLNMTANAWSYQFIFVGSRDKLTLGKYWTTAPNKQVRYTDHGRVELGTWSCPGQ